MLGWILLGAGLASTLGCEKPSEPLVVGDALPISELSPNRLALVWVFAANRCLGCTLAPTARTLRRVQHRFGERVDLVVIAISDRGREDHGLVNSFLRAERVNGRIDFLSPTDHADDFGYDAPEPAVYFADEGRIAHILHDPNAADVDWYDEEIMGMVERLLSGPVPTQ